MTEKELLQQALDALSMAVDPKKGKVYAPEFQPIDCEAMHIKAIEALRAKLAQPDGVQGDVIVQIHTGNGWIRDSQLEAVIATGWVPPTPKKEWVGLTDEEQEEPPKDLELPLVRPAEFVKLIQGKENYWGIPVMRTEWPTPEPVIQARKEGNLIVADLPQVPTGGGGISKREWVGLTDMEALNAFDFHLWPESFLANVSQELKDTHEEAKKEVLSKVHAIEAKLKEKNNG